MYDLIPCDSSPTVPPVWTRLIPLLVTLAMSSKSLEIQGGGWKLSPPKQTTKKKKSCKSDISNACRQPVLQKEQPQKGFRPHEHKSLWASENQMYEGRLISLWQSVKWESNARQLYKKLLILKIREIKDFYLFSQNERKRIHGSQKKK